MAAVEAVSSNRTEKKGTFNHVHFECAVKGKVESIDEPQNSERRFYTVRIAAADSYSSPQTMQIQQDARDRPFAREGDEIECTTKVGGYTRRSNGNTYVTNTHDFIELI